MKRVEGEESSVKGRGSVQVTRREAVGYLTGVPLALILGCTSEASNRLSRIARQVAAIRTAEFRPTFFTPHEYDTVRLLVDLVIPRDQRSGGATDAGVPEFMDFMMADQDTSPEARTAMRDGLVWIDAESGRRFKKPFLECAEAHHTAILDDIAWPARARPEMSPGVAFFNAFRDLTASGFWSSEMGVKDLQYRGNAFVQEWTGCPAAVLKKVGVRYEAD